MTVSKWIITLDSNFSRMAFLSFSNFPSSFNRGMVKDQDIGFSLVNFQQHTVVGFQENWRCDRKGWRRSFHDGFKIECFCILTVLEFCFLIDSFNYKQLTLDYNTILSCNNKTVQSNETDGFLFPSDNGKSWSWTSQ